jgi:hypothetical protein
LVRVSPKYILLALASVSATALLLFLLFGQKPLEPLVELAVPPRPPAVADKQTQHQLLSGLLDPFPSQGVEDVVNAKRRARNALAERHALALEKWKQGRLALRDVEAIEEMLIVARERTGELSPREMHEALALLFEREVQRMEGLHESGHAGDQDLARARLYLGRELFLAGQAAIDPRAAAYPADREAFLAATRRKHDTLVESALAKRSYLQLEYEDLLADFPPPPEPPPAPPSQR